MPNEIWIIQEDGTIYLREPDTTPFVRKAFLDSPENLTVVLSKSIKKENLLSLNPVLTLKTQTFSGIKQAALIPADADSSNILQLTLNVPIDIADLPGNISVDSFKTGPVFLRDILTSPDFFSNAKLGADYSAEKTLFSLYTPGATAAILNLYDQARGGKAEKYELNRESNGLWSLTIAGNLEGMYYTYSIDGPDPAYQPKVELIDPYATCVTTHNGRALIFKDNTPIANSPKFPLSEAVIYELHVRDFSIAENSGIANKGKYLGFTEVGTKLPGSDIKTGLDHLTELGVNTVQLLPVQDFEHDDTVNNYFWGYMTVNFNSPDGWYATEQYDASRINEFKRLVDTLHRRGIKVVLDVVYNHTAEASPDILYNFNGVVPNFYYRERPDGTYWNGSGCGNEVRSEQPMVRKFIIESLKYWVNTFKIDGFRFDLMGLIDMETIQTIVRDLRAIKPDIFLYGEPWTAGTTPIIPTIKGTQRKKGFAVFNDNFRDALKGPWYNTEPGYVQTGKNVEAVRKGIIGSITDFTDSPLEVINYTDCHDGRTLWDQLVISTEQDSSLTDTDLKAMNKLAAVLLFTSQGVPFIQAGQEFLRTKFGSHNSYNQPDKINKIRWDYKQENLDVFNYYRGLIQLRKEHPMLRMTTAEEIKRNLRFLENPQCKTPNNCIAYLIQRGNTSDHWRRILILINPNHRLETFTIPAGKWILIVNESIAGVDIIAPISETSVDLKPISALIMYE
jgi:pullulanase